MQLLRWKTIKKCLSANEKVRYLILYIYIYKDFKWKKDKKSTEKKIMKKY